MLTKVFVLQGASGSGKSTWMKQMADCTRRDRPFAFVHVVSADFNMIDADDNYVFSLEKQAEGHKKALRDFAGAVHGSHQGDHTYKAAIVVDNTNTRALFMEPYVALARAYGIEVEVLSFRAPASICAARNNGRAPEEVVRGMVEVIEKFTMPNHWVEDDGISFRVIRTG